MCTTSSAGVTWCQTKVFKILTSPFHFSEQCLTPFKVVKSNQRKRYLSLVCLRNLHDKPEEFMQRTQE